MNRKSEKPLHNDDELFLNRTFLKMCWKSFYSCFVPDNEFMAAQCHCERANWSWVSQACQGDEFVSRCSGMCVSAGPPCPLLTFVTSLTSAHSLLSTGQDARCVNNADTLQDLAGHLGTLEPGVFNSRQNRSIIMLDSLERSVVLKLSVQ